MLAVLLSIATFFSTLLGGLFALKNQDRLHRIMGFTAGVLLGVVTFDLMPEIYRLVSRHNFNFTYPMITLVIGFLAFHVAEKLTIIHSVHEGAGDSEYRSHTHPRVGVLSGLALSGHSFLDGVGIGLGFQVNAATGLLVALAVIAHDFSDGLNTVTLVLASGNDDKRARRFLLLDAITPVLGAASTLLFTLTDRYLVLYLGFFAGFLLYIGASHILPEAHAEHPSRLTLLLTILGTVLIFVVTRFV